MAPINSARKAIRHERIEPDKPQQNGRHERTYLTLKHETVSPPATSFRAQQRLFDRFRREFNELRPHEALGQRFSAEFYRSGLETWVTDLPGDIGE